jgi:uncharacterized membrane protein
MGITFVPFSTAILAENLDTPEHETTATLFYAANFTWTAIFFNALWFYAATNRRLIDIHVPDDRLRARTRRYLPGPLIYGIGVPLTLLTPWGPLGLYVAMSVLYLLPLPEGLVGESD